jgi:putative Holliday junction resolvase
MARIIALDVGAKRTGIAATDPLQMIASPLETVNTAELFVFLKKYTATEAVETIVVGMPTRLNNEDTHATPLVRKLINELKAQFPEVGIAEEDEQYTSKMALEAMIAAGSTKKQRRDKGNIDKVSAAIILQSYMQRQR